MCAFDKKPKIPIEVINININTANVRYDLSNIGAVFQLRYNQEAVTSLENSSEPPMITTGQKAPGNIKAKPIIE
jgi:hypothetical protein